ncbi:MAG: glycerophosphodiester phosphodiesterase family protein [Chloroflexi bacterium]|nr:glycerophosphodiester phosphodiesterase family protein [Chloroflexota bacterium]
MTALSTLRIVGHRGAAALAPENTMASFRQAVLAGVAAIEADARLASDGRVVLIHDDRLDRTTTYTGAVQGFTGDQLACFGVPDLRALLTGFDSHIDFYIDMKQSGPALPGAVAGVACRTGMSHRVWLTGTELRQLQHAHRLDGNIRLSWTLGVRHGTLTGTSVVEAALLGVEELAVNAKEVSSGLLELAHGFGVDVRAFGIDSPDEALMLIDLGCTTLTLDDPRVTELAATAV